MTTRILDTGASLLLQAREADLSPLQRVVWVNVLRSVSGNQAYRQSMRIRVSGPRVARFLLTDTHFPRSVAFCLGRIRQAFANLPRHRKPLHAINALRRGAFAGVDCDDLGPPFHVYLDDLQGQIGTIHQTLAATWFALPVAGRTAPRPRAPRRPAATAAR
jgi:uncharacterized alpha-E superfamily protein